MINDHSYGSSHYIYINVDTSIDKFDWKLKKNHFINFINFINFPLLVLLLLFVIQPIEFCIVSYSQKQESNNTVPWSTILSHNYPPAPVLRATLQHTIDTFEVGSVHYTTRLEIENNFDSANSPAGDRSHHSSTHAPAKRHRHN